MISVFLFSNLVYWHHAITIMRLIKLALISFLFFAVLIFLMSLLVPSRVRISKAINLAPTDTLVLQQVRDTLQWAQWHPAFQQGRPGNQTISKTADSDTLVQMTLRHVSGNRVDNVWELHRFGASDSLTLQWYMDFHLSRWPWHRFSSLLYEGTYGKMMEQGLHNLKERSNPL